MTPENFATFAVCLEYLPHGTAPAWDAGCARFYFAVLSDLPDQCTPILMKAVGTQFTFRPTPHDILAVWRKISAPPAAAAEEMAGRMLLKRREKGLYQRKIPDDPYARWETCEPPWASHQETERRMSLGMGGWAAFCADPSPLGVLRGQLVKLAAVILGGADADSLELLRLEYAENRRLAAPAPALTEPDEADAAPMPPFVSRAEATQIMNNMRSFGKSEAVEVSREKETAQP